MILTATAVMAGASIMMNESLMNESREGEFVETTEAAPADPAGPSVSEATVAADHEMHDAGRMQSAVRGLMAKAALGMSKAPRAVRAERGIASSYGNGFNGRKTANGEIYNQNTYTAAHKKLPFGTRVLVKNLRNGREVVVRINNRGPYVRGRIIDVSLKAARELGMLKAGVVPVEVTVLQDEAGVLASAQ